MVAGRPEKPIDWDMVDQMIMQQCTADEIAGEFGLHRSSFYNKIEKKYGENFSTYSTALYCKGKRCLRSKQWEKAMEGDVRLLLKLGEIHLGQSENKINESDQQLTVKIIDARSNSPQQI